VHPGNCAIQDTEPLHLPPEFKRVEEYMCAENAKEYDFLFDPKKKIKLP
jgi:hypothetical protein